MKTTSLIKLWFARLRESRWLNKYTIAFSIFFVWMIFFDKHNVIVQYRMKHTLNQMDKKIGMYAAELEAAQIESYELRTYKERYAREKYYMHKSDEEVFVIVRE